MTLLGRAVLLVRRYLRGQRGSIAITFALALPALLCGAGVALDMVTAARIKSSLQATADAAAIAGARELAIANPTKSQVQSAARGQVDASATNHDGQVIDTVDVDFKAAQVNLSLSLEWTPFMAQMVGLNVTPVRASASAKLMTSASNICVLALEPTEPKGVLMTDTSAITANNCGIYANSTDDKAIKLDGASTVKASMTCSSGGVRQNTTGTVSPAPITDCPAVPDPLAQRQPPPVGACDFTGKKVNGTVTAALTPGVYCGGLTINGKATVTFSPGIYVIKDGPLKLTGNATMSGTDVGFYFTGAGAVLHLTGSADVRFRGPQSGPMAGLLFFEDRNVAQGQQHAIHASGVHELVGTIYLSRNTLRIDPNSPVSEGSAYTAIIVNQLDLGNAPNLVLNSDYKASNVPVPEGISGNGQVVLIQ
jgi:Putative Flp pilus-assembly TadE/G-like